MKQVEKLAVPYATQTAGHPMDCWAVGVNSMDRSKYNTGYYFDIAEAGPRLAYTALRDGIYQAVTHIADNGRPFKTFLMEKLA